MEQVRDVAMDEQLTGSQCVMVSAGTRLSEQPIHSTCGFWPRASASKKPGVCSRVSRAHAMLATSSTFGTVHCVSL